MTLIPLQPQQSIYFIRILDLLIRIKKYCILASEIHFNKIQIFWVFSKNTFNFILLKFNFFFLLNFEPNFRQNKHCQLYLYIWFNLNLINIHRMFSNKIDNNSSKWLPKYYFSFIVVVGVSCISCYNFEIQNTTSGK